MPTNTDTIDKLVDKISTLFSNNGADGQSSASSLKDDLQRNLRAVLQSTFSKLDMVSRDEFDAQVAVLHRSREKIEQLEQQLKELLQQQQG